MKIKTIFGIWLLGMSVVLGGRYAIEDGEWYCYDSCGKMSVSASYILNSIWPEYYGNTLNGDYVREDDKWYYTGAGKKEEVPLEEVLERNRDFILAKLNEKASF